MSFYNDIKSVLDAAQVQDYVQGCCIAQILEDLLETSLADTIEEVVNEPIDYDDFFDSVESYQLSRNKLKKYFTVTTDCEVKMTKRTKGILREVITSTGYSRFFE